MFRITTILFLVTGSLLAVFHAVALQTSLYWQYEWFDIPMHALGGMVLVFALATLRDIRLIKHPRFFTFGPVMSTVFITAVIWEVFGVVLVVGGFKEDFIVDTALDMVMGLLGAAVAFFVARSLTTLE